MSEIRLSTYWTTKMIERAGSEIEGSLLYGSAEALYIHAQIVQCLALDRLAVLD